MKAAQIRSLPVQGAMTAALFVGCVVLSLLIVSQRFRFESFVKESYELPKQELSKVALTYFEDLIDGQVDPEKWRRVPQPERRNVYLRLMQREVFPDVDSVQACLRSDSNFFIECAERTVVCGNAEQRMRGLKFLELAGIDRAKSTLDRLLTWTNQTKRLDQAHMIEELRDRMQRQSTL